MSDRISLCGVRARGFHGVLAHEKVEGQDFVVDVLLTSTSAGRPAPTTWPTRSATPRWPPTSWPSSRAGRST